MSFHARPGIRPRGREWSEEVRIKGGERMIGHLKRFLKDERGPTAVEYAIMLALVALAIALASPNIRDAVIAIFNATSTALTGLNP